MAFRAAALACLVLIGSANASALRDVPLGECHQCEVTCFEDCSSKFDMEIIQAEQREYEYKQKMIAEHGTEHAAARGLSGSAVLALAAASAEKNRTHVFAWRKPTDESPEEKKARKAKEIDRTNSFAKCLERERCSPAIPPQQALRKATAQCLEYYEKPSLIALRGGKARLPQSVDPSCAIRCATEVEGTTALAQVRSEDFPSRPVMVGSFSRIGLTLDFCFKSCLAVTCGCSDAPGFEKLSKMHDQVKNNLGAGAPVADTKPTWQYAPATLAECGKGMKKVSSKMFVYSGKKEFGDGGWTEICTSTMIESMYGKAFPEMKQFLKRCESHEPEDDMFGCEWNDDKGKCLAGFVPVEVECNVQVRMDISGPGIGAPPPVLSGEHAEGVAEVLHAAKEIKEHGPW